LSFALLGGLREHLGDDMLADSSMEAVAGMKFRTKAELEAWFDATPELGQRMFEMLDLNRDGVIDMYELAVLELEGAGLHGDTISETVLSGSEALALANGAVREDGEIETDHVDKDHFRGWIVDAMWKQVVGEDDRDLGEEDWAELSTISLDQIMAINDPSTSFNSDTQAQGLFAEMLDFPLPSGAVDSLVTAGAALSQVLVANGQEMPLSLQMQGNRRLIAFAVIVAGVFLGGAILIALAILLNSFIESLQG